MKYRAIKSKATNRVLSLSLKSRNAGDEMLLSKLQQAFDETGPVHIRIDIPREPVPFTCTINEKGK